MPTPTWLKNLVVKEISLVDRGANPGAVSVLMKRAGEMGKDVKELINKIAKAFGKSPEEIAKISEGGDTMPNIEEVVKELKETVEKVKNRADLSDLIGKIGIGLSKAKNKKDVKEEEEDMEKAEKLDKNDARLPVLREMIKDALAKAAHHDAYSENLDGDEKTKFEAMPMKEKDAYMEKNPVKGGTEDGKDGGGNGNTDEDEEMEKKMKAVLKANADLTSKVEKMERENSINKIMADELKELKGVAKISDLAEAIFKLRKSNSPEVDLLVAELKKQAAVIKANDKILQELGKANAGAVDASSAEGQLEAMTQEMAKKRNVSVAKAQAMVLDTPEGAALYKQMEEEKKKNK